MIEVEYVQYSLEEITIKDRGLDEDSIKKFYKHGSKVQGRCSIITTMQKGKPVLSTMELYVAGPKVDLDNIINAVKAICEESN
jgi:hypothetical protein